MSYLFFRGEKEMIKRSTLIGAAALTILSALILVTLLIGVRGDSSTQHSLEAVQTEHGQISLSDTTLTAGKSFTVTATPEAGYRAAFVIVDTGSSRSPAEADAGHTSFRAEMPDNNVKVEALFVPEDQYGIALLYNSSRAECTLSQAWAADGEPVVLYVTPKSPYQVARISSDPAETAENMVPGENSSRLFNMPASDLCLTLQLARDAFEDVPDDAWYASYVYDIVDRGLMAGVSSTQFEPEGKITRAQTAQILYAMSGSPDTEQTSQYHDVSPGQWHCTPISWCTRNGVMAGYSSGNFLPDATITRQQMASVLFKYVTRIQGDPAGERNDLSAFADRDSISTYAVTSMQWAVARGIISGTSENGVVLIDPQGVVSRAQMAIMLINLLDGGASPAVTPTPENTPAPSETQVPDETPVPEDTPAPSDEGTAFPDVKSYSWYREAVEYCVAQGYMTPEADGRFLPDKDVTRAQSIQMLYHLADRPASSSVPFFHDVSDTAYYFDAVCWSTDHNISAGYADGTFRPNIPITRQQFIALLYRYAGYREDPVTPIGALDLFPDAGLVADYARTPMGWALHYSLIAGIQGRLVPTGTLSRSQMACILRTYDKNVADR